MLVASELYSSILGFMPSGSSWTQGSPQSLLITKCAEGLVDAFKASTVSPGPCNPSSPTPHSHSVSLNGAAAQAKIESCGFTGLANSLASAMNLGISGYLSGVCFFSVAPDGCPIHSHSFGLGGSASGLSSAMRPASFNGQYASSYLNAIASAVYSYIPLNVFVSTVSHGAPLGLHTLS